MLGSRGFDADYKTALKWNTIAGERGDDCAAHRAGFQYEHALGTPKDCKKAVKYYLLGAAKGNATCQKRLSEMYDQGLGIAKNALEAKRWRQAATSSSRATRSWDRDLFPGGQTNSERH